jgi:integrase
VHNVLVFTKHEKKFIYNYYKNAKKSYSQEVPITNPLLIKRLEAYLKKYKSDVDKKDPNRIRFLFESEDHEPLTKGDIERIMRDDIGKKYNIPAGLRKIRHMFVTHVVIDQKTDPRTLKDIAYRMGTSDLQMVRTYADIDNALKDDDT